MRRLALLLIPLLVGCASLNVENMVSDPASSTEHYPATVALEVSGGSAGVGWFSGTIKPEQLEEAIRLSLEKTTLFSQILPKESADYLLAVDLTYAGSHPGFNMTAWVNANWSLVQRVSGSNLWQSEVKLSGKATMGDAFGGARRQYIALERAAKANIEEAFTQLGGLHLNAP